MTGEFLFQYEKQGNKLKCNNINLLTLSASFAGLAVVYFQNKR